MPAAWRRAQSVARAALAGFVETSVGSATHYHADYVLPRWAFQLGKIEQIGRHIFYRFNGAWGNAVAFNGRYSAVERIPTIDYASLEQRLLEGSSAPLADLAPGLTVSREISDRHADNDVGGRLDVTKTWRLTIPDPVSASPAYRASIGNDSAESPASIELARGPKPEEIVR